MNKYSLDYKTLSNTLDKKVYKLSEVANKIEKIGFDIVRFKDSDPDELWQIQSADDGDYIIALYDEKSEETKTASDWSVNISKLSHDLHIFYKGDPIHKIASTQLGIPEKELGQVAKYLPGKLATNKKLVQSLLKDINPENKKDLQKKYPELF